MKRAALVFFAFYPDRAAVMFRDLLADRESNSGAGHGCIVQPFENAENPLMIFRRDADPIVLDLEVHEIPFIRPNRYMNLGPPLRVTVFDAVAQQVLQKLEQ